MSCPSIKLSHQSINIKKFSCSSVFPVKIISKSRSLEWKENTRYPSSLILLIIYVTAYPFPESHRSNICRVSVLVFKIENVEFQADM